MSILSVLFLLVLLAVVGSSFVGYQAAMLWIQGPDAQRLASVGLSKTIKCDGMFAPLHLEGWTVVTDSFESVGWPGEALGGINAYGIRAEFDPSALWDGAYKVTGIQIDHATVSLLKPDDALKRKMPPKKPKPWYAFMLPNRFVCGPIESQHANLDFEFNKQTSHLTDAHVRADLIDKDLKYTATSGLLEFPLFPPLHVDHLEMLVTRPMITIYDLEMSGLDPEKHTSIKLSGKLGQREDKTVDATVDITNMPIEQVLPDEMSDMIHAEATGHVSYQRDTTGEHVHAEGDLNLDTAEIDSLAMFSQMEMIEGNPDLHNFVFDKLRCKFHLDDGVFTADLEANVNGKFAMTGHIVYTLKTKLADLDIAFTDLPLQVWLPAELKPGHEGMASAKIHWHGHVNTVKESTGTLSINLDGAHITDPVLLKKALVKKGFRVPDDIFLQKAQFDFAYQESTFNLTRAEIDVPGILSATLSGILRSPDNQLDADLAWQGLKVQDWLPEEIADQFSGETSGKIRVHVRKWKMEDGSFGGDVQLANGQLRHTSVQLLMARFLNDRRLFEVPLTRASFSWTFDEQGVTISKLDLRGGDAFGVKGDVNLGEEKKLSGTLWVGAKPIYLDSLCGLADDVFTHKEDGLNWAKVKLSGTLKKPQQDLSSRLVAQLGNHPAAVIGLGTKLTSWYLGNLLGAADDWTVPGAAPDKDKTAAATKPARP